MTKLFGQAFKLGFLLYSLLFLSAEALKSQSRGVRGSRSLVVDQNSYIDEEDLYPRRVVDVVGRSLAETFKKDDKQKDQDKDAAVVESAFETDEPTDPPKEQDDDEEEEEEEEEDDDKENDKEDEEEEEETEEPTQPPKDDKEEEETEEPTDPPSPEEEEEEEVVDPEEQIDDMDDEDDTEDASIVLPVTPTDAPETEDTLPMMNDTDVTAWSVDLAPFTIEVDYDETITEDPGVEEYLYMEMIRGGGTNLDQIDLDMTVATVYDRRRLTSQVLYYTGTATFEGSPVYETEQVHSLQNQILTNEERLSIVMATSLGEDPSNFTVTSVTVEVTSDEVVQVEDGSEQQPPPPSGEEPAVEENELSTTGLAIVLIAACIGAISLTIICLVAIKKPDKKIVEPYGGKRSMIKVSTKEPAPSAADADPKVDLNKTFETEDDQVHEEFAQNMEKHNFDGSWNNNKGPVTMQASVGRGSFHEVSENDNADQDSNSEDLKKELGQQLSDLQASVKAAREKTQKLLDEAKAS